MIFFFFLTEEIHTIQYFGGLPLRKLGQAPMLLVCIPFLLGRCYHLKYISVCALRKYFFHIGPKREMNMD